MNIPIIGLIIFSAIYLIGGWLLFCSAGLGWRRAAITSIGLLAFVFIAYVAIGFIFSLSSH